MAVDNPHGGGDETLTAIEWARKLSVSDPTETYVLVERLDHANYVTNDTHLAHNDSEALALSYYQDGEPAQYGHELITSFI